MVQLPPGFLPHTVTIKPLTGSGGLGKTYGAPFTALAMVQDGSRMVRNAAAAEVVSTTQVHCEFSVIAPVGSLVTVWAGTGRERTAEVLAVAGSDHPVIPGHQTLALK
ncbi:hypothetical protein [Agromyces sp. NPDC058064]|uniref:hypothetical protein n=1 Tax=Agromyces sp. NPDC058064 TaxID=3346322 RepID=UPI0036DB4244